MAPPAPLALAHLLTKNLNYNPLDWVPITLLAKIANVLSVRNSLPANTLQELIAYGKANPGKLTFATQGAELDRASVGDASSRRWRASRCWRCPIAARSRR